MAFWDHLEWAEGRRHMPYKDSVGKLTIGVGRNLDDRGLRDDEIDLMKTNDIDEVLQQAAKLPYWENLNWPRQLVIADMLFNLGLTRFNGFKKLQQAIIARDYDWAADEMIDSRWYRQTGRRARKLVDAMLTGEWKCTDT